VRRVATLRDASRRAAVAEARAAQLAGQLQRAEDTVAELRMQVSDMQRSHADTVTAKARGICCKGTQHAG
jgi:hypothetical protein